MNLEQMHHITDAQIEASVRLRLGHDAIGQHGDYYSESYDSVRIAYEWLDAQIKINAHHHRKPIKHLIEGWGGRYISKDDVVTAASILGIAGEYKTLGISSKRLIIPDPSRLAKIKQASTHDYNKSVIGLHYKYFEHRFM
jgi:hypothetical protein